MGSILNSKGEYQIGDSLIWISGNNVFVIPNNDRVKLQEIQTSLELSMYDEYRQDVIQEIEFETANSENLKTTTFNSSGFQCSKGFHITGGEHRWVWEYRSVWNGSRYYLTFYHYLAYRSGKHWYLSNHIVRRRAYWGITINTSIPYTTHMTFPQILDGSNGYFKIEPFSSLSQWTGSMLRIVVDSRFDNSSNFNPYNVADYQLTWQNGTVTPQPW